MTNKTLQVDDKLYDYILRNSLREPSILRELRTETAKLEMARMQIAPEQGQFMALLLQLIGARSYLEVGTFTGYSALACALAMPNDGQVHALDISKEWTDIAVRYWQRAGVAERIKLHLGTASDTLAVLVQNQASTFDAIFIDADKTNYAIYIQYGYELLRPGGLMMIDNVLWGGRVADNRIDDEDTVALRRINESMHADDRFDMSLVPVADGLTLARKR